MKPYNHALVSLLLLLASCSATSAEHATEGAVVGGAAGALGGMFSAAIFGGDVGRAAARGAAWGAGSGVVHGAVKGAKIDAREQQKQAADERKKLEAELARIKAKIGDDAYDGLAALAKRKHEAALVYARGAMKSTVHDHELAGRWLEVLTYAEKRDAAEVDRLLPSVVEADAEVKDILEARRKLAKLQDGLDEIRKTFGLESS